MGLSTAEYNNILAIYQKENDSLLDNLGKKIVLFFEETVTATVPDDVDDPVRGENFRKPSYREDVPSITVTTREIKGLLQFNPKDYSTLDRINIPDGILRLKTYITEMQYLSKCNYLVPNYDVSNHIYAKYRLVRQPIPIGLKEDRYCISYWEKII